MKLPINTFRKIKMEGGWIDSIPNTIAIYMFAKNIVPLYIGKSINLRTRLLSHLKASILSPKERAFISKSDTIFYKPLLSDLEALILEAHAIRQYKPQYNIVLKDDKNPLYIKINKHHGYPKVSIVRNEHDTGGEYFGPFENTKLTLRLLKSIRAVVPFWT
jgi:excinuclease ABC subunit C